MSLGKPDSIEIDVWEKVLKYEKYKNPNVRYEEILKGVIKFKVMSMINNFHYFGYLERYMLIYCQDIQAIPAMIPKQDAEFFGEKFPDLFDRKENIYVTIVVVDSFESLDEMNLPVMRMEREKALLVSTKGEISPNKDLFLDEGQIQDIKTICITIGEEIKGMEVGENFEKYLKKGVYNKVIVGENFRKFLLRKTDLNFIPNTKEELGIEDKLRMRPWGKLENIPNLKYDENLKEACWRAFLIGSESDFLISDDVDDQGVVSNFFGSYPSFEMLRENGSFGSNEVKSFLLSISNFVQGNMRRSKIQEDIRGFGINAKLRKTMSTFRTGEWEQFSFEHERKSPPKWVEEELHRLVEGSNFKWLEFENLKEYTKLDEICEAGVDAFINNIKDTTVSSLIEKWVISCSKLQNEMHTDRNKITIIPIITRKKMDDVSCSQLWGFILLGPHHPRHDSDRIPLMTLEFCKRDNAIKYEKYSYGVLKSPSLGVGEEVQFLGRVYSMPKYKLFYFSYMRKVLLQPLNIYSKILLVNASETGQFNPLHNPMVEYYFKSRKIQTDTKTWIKLILSMEFLMAIHNDSQMEGFLANIRRLQMCRHALSERKEIYLPYLSKPENKCNECILNNPIVLHLARTWNSLPIVH